ncbi:hypothetical protein HOY82DRAFT_588384 [Tuber indicum]|nr:hypothetical protein HOY82DRAFT_588384 [Tuber indicum]
MPLSRREARKENQKAQRQGSDPLIEELEQNLAEEKDQVRKLVEKNQRLWDENVELRNKEEKSREELYLRVPVYKRAVGAPTSSFGDPVDRAAIIRSRKDKYAAFGCENEAQVEELANVSGVIDARNTDAHNTAAYLVTGDDVVEILPHCGTNCAMSWNGLSGYSGEYPHATGVTAKQL